MTTTNHEVRVSTNVSVIDGATHVHAQCSCGQTMHVQIGLSPFVTADTVAAWAEAHRAGA
jgi:hypothetical protein